MATKKKSSKKKKKFVSLKTSFKQHMAGLRPVRNSFGQITHFEEDIRWNTVSA